MVKIKAKTAKHNISASHTNLKEARICAPHAFGWCTTHLAKIIISAQIFKDALCEWALNGKLEKHENKDGIKAEIDIVPKSYEGKWEKDRAD